MKDKLRRCAIFLIIPLHLLFSQCFVSGNHKDWFYLAAVLAVQLADFALSAWQMELFTSKRNSIRIFARAFLPYLLQKVALLAIELILMFAVTKGDFSRMSSGFGYAVAYGAAAVTAVLSALVTFVTGAARTMMYHDEKR